LSLALRVVVRDHGVAFHMASASEARLDMGICGVRRNFVINIVGLIRWLIVALCCAFSKGGRRRSGV
jgi:hypothetical protein